MWKIDFFKKNNGRCPVDEFMDEQDKKIDIPYFIQAIELLEENGYRLRRPHAAPLRDDIYELRVSTRNGQFRFFYFFYDRHMIIITHGAKKKTRKVPPEEIDRALRYRSDYYDRNENQK